MVCLNWSACASDEVIPKGPFFDMLRKSANGSLLERFRSMRYIVFISWVNSVGVTRNADGRGNIQTIYSLYGSDYRASAYFRACETISKAATYFKREAENEMSATR